MPECKFLTVAVLANKRTSKKVPFCLKYNKEVEKIAPNKYICSVGGLFCHETRSYEDATYKDYSVRGRAYGR